MITKNSHRPKLWKTSLRMTTKIAKKLNHGNNNNKKAQLSLGKTRYSIYSFCCSTDLQGHL